MMKPTLIGLAAALVLAAAPVANAQKDRDEVRDERGDWRNKETYELVNRLMMVRMAEKLELSDEEAAELTNHFDEFRKTRMEHRRKSSELMSELRDTVESEQSEDVIQAKLDAVVDHEKRYFAMRDEFMKTVTKEMNTEQRAKFVLLMNDFDRDMRRLIQRAREKQRENGDDNRDSDRQDFRRNEDKN